jgi:hypothetical protein
MKILCTVNASPSNVTFWWTANQTQFDNHYFISDGLTSTLSFKPFARRDIDSIWCWASNSVGKMKKPCSFSLLSTGPPSAVNDCVIINQTSSSVIIDCNAGYDGGIDQTFHLELYANNRQLIMNKTNGEKPSFILQDLESGYSYFAVIYSSNPKGNSESFQLKFQTLKLLNKKFSMK